MTSIKEQLRKCFTDTEMEHDDELILFDTDQTIKNLEALIDRVVEEVIGEDEPTAYGKITHDSLREAQNETKAEARQRYKEMKSQADTQAKGEGE